MDLKLLEMLIQNPFLTHEEAAHEVSAAPVPSTTSHAPAWEPERPVRVRERAEPRERPGFATALREVPG